MKSILLFYFFIGGLSLYSESYLDLQSGVSYPDGLLSGIAIESDSFNSALDIFYSEETLKIDRAFFNSDFVSLGSISFKGFLKDQNYEKLHYSKFAEETTVEINREGNPANNLGFIFFLPNRQGGLSGFRTEGFSQILFWKNIYHKKEIEINFKHSFTLNENPPESDTWYIEDPLFKSSLLSDSSISFLAGDEQFFLGGSFHFCGAPDNAPGFSISPIVGISFSDLLIQNELTINSPDYTSADLKINPYPFVYLGKLELDKSIYKLDNELVFYFGRDPFPGENRLWRLSIDSQMHFERDTIDLNGDFKIKFYNDISRSLLFSASFSAAFKKSIGDFFIEAEGSASYDELYFYELSVKTGIENNTLKVGFSSEIEVDDKIIVNGAFSLIVFRDNFDFIGSLTLESIGLYNSEPSNMKASFFIGIELKHIQLQP